MPIPCLICGGRIDISDYIERKCLKCGEKEKNDLVCEKGHYVCRRCHISKRPKDEHGLPIF